MKSNSIALGDRIYEGEYNRLLIAGDATITNSTVRKIYCAGDLDIAKTSIGKIKFAGDLIAESVTIKECKGAGDANFKGLCKADSISMIGDITADYLECIIIKNGSSSKIVKVNSTNTPTWNGVFKAETFENHYPLSIKGDFDFKNIILCDRLTTEIEITCENIYILSDVIAECINSESIYIQATSNINISSLTGSNVLISAKFKPDSKLKAMPKSSSIISINREPNIVNIDSIEADNIDIEYTKSELVCGSNVKIGDLCIVDRVEYSEQIEISDKAIVNEVIKI